MAYYTQEMKKAVAPKIKAALKKYGLTGSLSVRDHSCVRLTIKKGKIDFIKNAIAVDKKRVERTGNHSFFNEKTTSIDVNTFHIDTFFSGNAADALNELNSILNEGNWDKSDYQSDYFNVGFYVDIQVGRWDKPYEVVA